MPKKILRGVVVSTKMEKTAVVSVETAKAHKVYKKLIRTHKKYKARNDLNVEVGNMVEIEECMPFSKTVTWQVVKNLSAEAE